MYAMKEKNFSIGWVGTCFKSCTFLFFIIFKILIYLQNFISLIKNSPLCGDILVQLGSQVIMINRIAVSYAASVTANELWIKWYVFCACIIY